MIAPSTTTARDGLGPLFNTNACQNCHIKDGRGHPPLPDAPNAVSMLVRLSIAPPLRISSPTPNSWSKQAWCPSRSTAGNCRTWPCPASAPEGKVRVDYAPVNVTFKDGTVVELRKPDLQITQLGYGPMHPDTRFSARIAPPMIGLGLLEAISDADILRNTDPKTADKEAILGRAESGLG